MGGRRRLTVSRNPPNIAISMPSTSSLINPYREMGQNPARTIAGNVPFSTASNLVEIILFTKRHLKRSVCSSQSIPEVGGFDGGAAV